MKEKILSEAVEKLNKVERLSCRILGKKISIRKQIVDAQIQLMVAGHRRVFNVAVKSKIVPAQIPAFKSQVKNLEPFMLIADYITTPAKEILRNHNISYLDTAGNTFLQNDHIYIHIETGKTNRKKLAVDNRAFSKAGLKVIYQLLINPETLNLPYRFIGDQAMVAIDTVGRVMQELLREKYVVQITERKYQFSDRTRLFQDWVTAFNKTLRPKLKQSRCKSPENQIDLGDLPEGTYWGGAVAAEMLTDHLIANDMIIYTDLSFHTVMKHFNMIPDPTGSITIIEKFWKKNFEDKTVNHMLIYADLINEKDPRYLETADKIYTNYVRDQL